MTLPLIALVIAFAGLMVLGFLATGVLLPRASARRKNILSALALVAVAVPAILALIRGAL
jgi:hypothetical protein